MNNDFVSISGKFLPRRMVLQGIASLFGEFWHLVPSPLRRTIVS